MFAGCFLCALYCLSTANFYSFLMEGTADAGNVEDELIVIMSFRKDDTACEVGSLLGTSA